MTMITDGVTTDGSTGSATTNPATTNPATTNPATTNPATTNPATTNPATDAAAIAAGAIPVLRGQIDSLDEAIIRLVAERAKLSSRVQIARMNAGGTRVQLGRERVILDAYRSALGAQGPALADAVLQVCRGAR